MWPNPQETVDLVTFTEELLNEKLHFLCSEQDSYEYTWNTLQHKILVSLHPVGN